MGPGTIMLGMAVFALLVFVLIGGPAVLMDWLRRRNEEATRQQIAITDAIDGQLGPIVAPMVKNPLWGPWQVQIAVPVMQPGAVGKILQLVDEVLTTSTYVPVEGYRVVLTRKPDAIRQETIPRTGQSAERWLGDARLAA